MNAHLYRVRVESTGSLQPGRGTTYWRSEVLYCGTDRLEALAAYHRSRPTDYGGSHGNPCAETLFEVLDTDELPDNEPGEMREEVRP